MSEVAWCYHYDNYYHLLLLTIYSTPPTCSIFTRIVGIDLLKLVILKKKPQTRRLSHFLPRFCVEIFYTDVTVSLDQRCISVHVCLY